MVRRVQKRSRKYRGSRTHGWGAGKKHRGKGNVGGKGYAWDKHLWVQMLKYDPDHFGKHGFKSIYKKETAPPSIVNVGWLDEAAELLLQQKLAEKEGNKIKIEAAKVGASKILGSGKVKRPLIIVCDGCSKIAKEKIEKAGGEVRNAS